MSSFDHPFHLIIYSLLNDAPYLLLALYAFKNRFRFSLKITLLGAVTALLLQSVLTVVIAYSHPPCIELMDYLRTVLNFVFLFVMIKAYYGKLLFTMFMLTNIANFVVSLAKWVDMYLFPSPQFYAYCTSYTFVLAVFEFFILFAVFFYFKSSYTSILRDTVADQVWSKIWLLPALFYLIWYYLYFHLTTEAGACLSLIPNYAVFSGLLLICQFLCYEIALSLALSHSNFILLQHENGNYRIVSEEFLNLKEDINHARRINHDFRHHITMIAEYVNTGKFSELTAYLSALQSESPQPATQYYCEHAVINLLLAHTNNLAVQEDITFDVQAYFPAVLPFADNELTIIFGNFLENAVQACKEQEHSPKKIKVRGYVNENYLLCTIDNTRENNVVTNKNGMYISSKHNGNGIGIESAKYIIEKHQGVLKINTHDMMFCVSFMIPLGNLTKTALD